MMAIARYYRRIGAQQDYAKAAEWYLKAAELGNKSGMVQLGFAYQDGKGVPVDIRQALHWFHAAVRAGDTHSMFFVARIYAWSDCCSSPAEGATWYRRAIDAGHSDALNELASLYDDTTKGIYDPVEAVKWYTFSAERQKGGSSLRAMLELAMHYRDGVGTACDREMAKQWLRTLLANECDNSYVKDKATKMLKQMEQEFL